MTIEERRALTIAENSLRYNPDLEDIEVQNYEMILANMRDSASAQQAVEKNEPLTLDDLREMDGQPVYLPIGKCWALVGENEFGPLLVFSNVDDCSAKDWYENCGQAYRRPPTEKGDGDEAD